MAGGAGDAGGAVGDGGFQVDPNMDPELAMALRLSMEEANANANQAANADPAPNQEAAAAGGSNPAGTQPGLNAANQDNDDMYSDDGQDEDAALQEALELSRVPDKPDAGTMKAAEEAPKKEEEKKPTTADVNIDDDFMNDVMKDLGIDGDDGKKDEDKDKDKKDGDKK